MKVKAKWIAIGILAFMSITALVSAGIPDTLKFAIENATQTIFTVDKLGHANFSGNIQTDLDLYVDGKIYTAADALKEASVDFDTACASGSHLYVNGNNLACEVDSAYNSSYEYWTNATLSSLDRTWSGELLPYDNVTHCSDTEILKMSGGHWSCQADATGDGEGDVYVNETGDTMTGSLILTNTNITLSTGYGLNSSTTNAYFYFDADGGLVVHLEA